MRWCVETATRQGNRPKESISFNSEKDGWKMPKVTVQIDREALEFIRAQLFAALRPEVEYTIDQLELSRKAHNKKDEHIKRALSRLPLAMEKAAGDFCGSCGKPWPCECPNPDHCCGICTATVSTCMCSERKPEYLLPEFYWANMETGRVLAAVESPGETWQSISYEEYENALQPKGGG